MNSPKSHEENQAFLKGDPNYKRWYSNNSKGSVVAAEIHLRNVSLFCKAIKKTPKEYASLPKNEMEDLAQDYANTFEERINPQTKKPYSPGYVQNILDSIRNWAAWNRKAFERKIKVKDSNSTPTLEEERIPTQEELRRALYGDKTALRTRTSISIMAFSGCRPEVQGNYLGIDGLKIKDLPEMEITEKGEIKFLQVPTMIVVRREISKIRKQYFTFLNEEGCEILKQYLERRIQDGEKLTRDSGIVVTSRIQAERSSHFKTKDSSPFLRTPKISENIREAMRAVSLPWRPYVFRSYFDTNLMMAEGKGMISHSYQQFLMGHSGDIERTYTLSKNHLPQEVIEDMRLAYKKASDYLVTSKTASSNVAEQTKQWREAQLLDAGYSQAEIEKMNSGEMSSEDFRKAYRDRLTNFMIQNGNRQKVILLAEIERSITEGYEFLKDYTDHDGTQKAIVKLPY